MVDQKTENPENPIDAAADRSRADANADTKGVGGGRASETLTDTALRSESKDLPPPPPFSQGPALRLAHEHKVPPTAPDEKCEECDQTFAEHGKDHQFKRAKFKPPYHRPVTEDAHVNIGMGLRVFFPSREQQISGFTPYYVDEDGKKQNATRIVLENFLGIYKSVEPGAEEKARLAEGQRVAGIAEGVEGRTGTDLGTAGAADVGDGLTEAEARSGTTLATAEGGSAGVLLGSA